MSNVLITPSVGPPRGTLGNLLLDSNLIITTNKSELYNVKLINCGNYVQVYYLEKSKIKSNKKEKTKNITSIDTDELKKITKEKNNTTIEFKNIMRSKLQCQRLAKTNALEWSTFITLTFEQNISNIDEANKRFRYFVDKVKRVYKSFKYICIPEFQKRGAVHYHLLTNIDIDNKDLIYSQENNPKFKHVKYWIDGFTKVDNLKKDIKKIVGYISKYMTKDADNRLYNHRRYFYSRNLKQPTINFLNLENPKHLEFYSNMLQQKTVIYENVYTNRYDSNLIAFKEFM